MSSVHSVARAPAHCAPASFERRPACPEDMLLAHLSAREAAVVGVPANCCAQTFTAYAGTRPVAVVEPARSCAYCAEQPAARTNPRQGEILPDLPEATSGKILGREPRSRL
ncbi:hypothetical protein ABZ208_15685 [Streptomyces sp. NPDC006208]|uniref:hypothetical protein n=1 Tax=Streptomyces sp. NPDC006208 TaxID=3156734 RepID=UPI0033AA9207